MNHYGHVYKIVCKLDGRLYIGQTIQKVSKRWSAHVYDAKKRNNKDRLRISRAIAKYGIENFEIFTICAANNQKELNDREIFCIRIFNSIKNGFNIHEGGKNQRLSKETREKISLANKGKKRTAESKVRYRLSRLGKKTPDYVKIKCSESQLGEKSAWWGKKHSKETIEKIRYANLGKIITEEQKNKQSKKMTGRKASEETRQKMSAKRSGRKPNQKKIICINTGIVYDSVKSAAKSLGISEGYIHLGLKNKTPMKGYFLEYV